MINVHKNTNTLQNLVNNVFNNVIICIIILIRNLQRNVFHNANNHILLKDNSVFYVLYSIVLINAKH